MPFKICKPCSLVIYPWRTFDSILAHFYRKASTWELLLICAYRPLTAGSFSVV
jgi:hypothetical protein